MDTIGDYLTKVRNAIKANHRIVEVSSSGLKKEITRILKDKGFILDYKVEENPVQDKIKIALKYHPTTKLSAIRKIQRASRPDRKSVV